jgi:hypothetical protein
VDTEPTAAERLLRSLHYKLNVGHQQALNGDKDGAIKSLTIAVRDCIAALEDMFEHDIRPDYAPNPPMDAATETRMRARLKQKNGDPLTDAEANSIEDEEAELAQAFQRIIAQKKIDKGDEITPQEAKTLAEWEAAGRPPLSARMASLLGSDEAREAGKQEVVSNDTKKKKPNPASRPQQRKPRGKRSAKH